MSGRGSGTRRVKTEWIHLSRHADVQAACTAVSYPSKPPFYNTVHNPKSLQHLYMRVEPSAGYRTESFDTSNKEWSDLRNQIYLSYRTCFALASWAFLAKQICQQPQPQPIFPCIPCRSTLTTTRSLRKTCRTGTTCCRTSSSSPWSASPQRPVRNMDIGMQTYVSVGDGRVLRCYGSTHTSQRACHLGTGWRSFYPLTVRWACRSWKRAQPVFPVVLCWMCMSQLKGAMNY